MYGALGGFIVKFAITEFSTTEKTSTRASSLWIHEVACYVRDTYEFLNEANKDQLLGCWNSHGAVKSGVVEYFFAPDHVEREGLRYFKVTNNGCNCCRAQHDKGGGLFVYFTVKKVPASIRIYLSDADFGECLYRAEKV